MKYRKKPIMIEAFQLLQNNESIIDCIEFIFSLGMETSVMGRDATVKGIIENNGFFIETLEGKMKASFGDYIIKGIAGEFYPCKPDIFEASYEKVEAG